MVFPNLNSAALNDVKSFRSGTMQKPCQHIAFEAFSSFSKILGRLTRFSGNCRANTEKGKQTQIFQFEDCF